MWSALEATLLACALRDNNTITLHHSQMGSWEYSKPAQSVDKQTHTRLVQFS